jgi:antitoxin component YwqK of YwqJK toxin-antitoxin module
MPVLFAVLLVGCVTNDAVVDGDQLRFRDGLYTYRGEPFTGVAVDKHDNGQKQYEGTWKDGKQHGLWTYWYENGQKKMESTYKDGNRISSREWDRDGNLPE